MAHFGKQGIIYRLKQLDEDLLSIVSDGRRIELVIVGGSALLMLDLVGETRMTTDIDVLEIERLAETMLDGYDMNQHVSTFRYRMPENWNVRRQRIPFTGMVLDVFAPSNEDLLIMKLDAFREVDQKDIREMLTNGAIILEKLEMIIHDDTELRINFTDENEWAVFLRRLSDVIDLARPQEETP